VLISFLFSLDSIDFDFNLSKKKKRFVRRKNQFLKSLAKTSKT